jgi:nucleotide-binding universal stress UspA family protein
MKARLTPKDKPASRPGRVKSEFRLRRILAPIDFSPAIEKPLAYAASLARFHRAKIDLFHVTRPLTVCVDCGYGPVNRQGPDDTQLRKDRSRLKRAASRYFPTRLLQGIHIRNGVAWEEIVRAARELQVDLIVLYAHSTEDPKVFGSHETADQVVRNAPCPVLIVTKG